MFVMCSDSEGDPQVSHSDDGRLKSGLETEYRVLGSLTEVST